MTASCQGDRDREQRAHGKQEGRAIKRMLQSIAISAYKTASAGKLLQDRRAREGGCQDPALAMAFWHGGRAREARAGQAGGPPEGAECTLV